MNVLELTKQAVAKATLTRLTNGLPLNTPICPVDLAVKLDLEVRYVACNSFEGIYQKDAAIVIGSKRPITRQNYTCAHELGHHVFGHGTKMDEYIEGNDKSKYEDPEERLAQSFAGHLLMPEALIRRTLNERNINAVNLTKKNIYEISCYFGVGYQTLLMHLQYGCSIISNDKRLQLTPSSLSEVRAEFGVSTPNKPLIFVDRQWTDRPIDTEVGDLIVCPSDFEVEGMNLIATGSTASLKGYEAVTPGMSRMYCNRGEWAAFCRTRKKHFEGRAVYRHMEEVEE